MHVPNFSEDGSYCFEANVNTLIVTWSGHCNTDILIYVDIGFIYVAEEKCPSRLPKP